MPWRSGSQALASGRAFHDPGPEGQGRVAARRGAAGFRLHLRGDRKRHHRICVGRKPAVPIGLAEAVEAGRLRLVEGLGLWSQPGVFSWDRLDPGTALLLDHLPALAGRGADFGCGIGILAKAALASAKVKAITLVDIDGRAVEAARRNVEDHAGRDPLGGSQKRRRRAGQPRFRRHEPALSSRRRRRPGDWGRGSCNAPRRCCGAAACSGSRPIATCRTRRC